MVLLAWGRSHRTTADGELIRWGTDLARVEGIDRARHGRGRDRAGRCGRDGRRKRIRVNGLGRRATGPRPGCCGSSLFAPEEMLLVAGSPSLRRGGARPARRRASSPAYADALATYGRTLQQRNSLLRAIREEGASRDELRFWDGAFLDAGAAIVAERRRLLEVLAEPAGRGPRRDRPGRGRRGAADPRATRRTRRRSPGSRRGTRWPGAWPRPPRRRSGTAPRSIGPHRDDLVFELDGRDLATLRLARPAADRDPRPQAGRARPPHGARRPAAAAAARRRLLRARPGAALAPGAADRRAAPGVRDDDDARRPRPRAAGDRDGLGGPHRTRPGRRLVGRAGRRRSAR